MAGNSAREKRCGLTGYEMEQLQGLIELDLAWIELVIHVDIVCRSGILV